MAISATDPYTSDPSVPRKITPTGVVLDPTANTATAIQALPDGQGGTVPVPPPSLSPLAPSVRPLINTMPDAAPTGPAPGTFDATNNLINAQINPAGDTNRVDLGQKYYDTFNQRAQANFGRSLKDATNAAAAHGQIGSGMLTNRYGDLAERFNLDNTTAASDFATRALEGTIGDQARGREELRGERDYQQSLAEQAIQRRIQQQQQEFGQGATLYGLAQQADPTGAYLNASGQASGEAASSAGDVGALIRAWLARQGGA